MNPLPPSGRLASIDYGHVRIGIAVSDAGQQFASPLMIYTRRDSARDSDFFRQLVDQESIAGFVVGLPLHSSGEESQKSREVRQFANWLGHVTSRPLQFHDERFTTVQAEQLLAAAHLTRKKRQHRRDMIAAQLILASYLEADRGVSPRSPLGDDR
jgi:putative holliday junction resolvase